MKRIVKILFSVCFVACAFMLSLVGYYQQNIGDVYNVSQGGELVLEDAVVQVKPKSRTALEVGKSKTDSVAGYTTSASLFGVIPIKNVKVVEVQSKQVAVLGEPFGIKIFTEGVLVVGYSDIKTKDGLKNPAATVGIKKGDIILKINGREINGNSDVQEIIKSSKGQALKITVKRSERQLDFNLTPTFSDTDNAYKIGIWIRDSSAGIGTLTYYDPATNILAGLGHGICDADTGELVPCESGQFVGAEIVGIEKSSKEVTGELQGVFSGGTKAEIVCNDQTGVFAYANSPASSENVVNIALMQEIKQGKAQILTTVDGKDPQYYDCIIKKVYHNDSSKIKNMIIEVTDPELLQKTGGIVQGMSGSPIIQNGKLVGAVTHVFVNDPAKGYGIFAENMLETAQGVGQGLAPAEKIKDAS